MKEDIPSKSKAEGKGFVACLYAAIVVAYWDGICGRLAAKKKWTNV